MKKSKLLAALSLSLSIMSTSAFAVDQQAEVTWWQGPWVTTQNGETLGDSLHNPYWQLQWAVERSSTLPNDVSWNRQTVNNYNSIKDNRAEISYILEFESEHNDYLYVRVRAYSRRDQEWSGFTKVVSMQLTDQGEGKTPNAPQIWRLRIQ